MGILAALPFFRVSNYLEAGLWIVIGVGFALYAVRADAPKGRCLAGAVAFVLFGFSDVVEAGTGAWYRPWWLLVWKGMCLIVIAWLLVDYVLRRRVHHD